MLATENILKPLIWDTEFFGIRVGELIVSERQIDDSLAVLEANASNFDLIYLRGGVTAAIERQIERTFNGQRTDTRAVFELMPITIREAVPARLEGRIEIAAARETSAELIHLAIQSSARSRFRNDDRFPKDWVDRLYTTWIEQSIAGDLADEVLVLLEDGRPIGLHTIRITDGAGSLELFAVDRDRRGLGVGSALIMAGLAWMRDHGATRATVATQLSNPVCRLYREFGYSLQSTEDIMHLWPNSGPETPGSSNAS